MAQKNLHINIRIGLQQVQRAVGALSRRFNLLRSSLRAVFRTGVVAGFFAALRSGMKVITNLQDSVKRLASEFAQLRMKATETAAIITKGGAGFTSAFEQALTMSRDLSTQIGFSAQQIQEGMVTAARSGLQLNESLTITGTAMQLATAHGEEFQSTLNDLIGVTRAFGVELSEIPVFADALTTAVTESNVSLSGLFQGLKNVASVASTAFGETRETIVDTTAALMTLNDAGIQSQKAGTRLRAAFQKLLGGTARTTAAFTKYGVNLFRANAESQRFLGTLTNGQRAMANTEERLNELKNRQFELVVAGKENTEEFMNIQSELDGLNGKLGTLEEGLDNVYRQFTLAGGKLKPFSEIIKEIGDKAPAEVIGRAFGIRGGEAIMRLLKDVDKFDKFKKSIEGYIQASEKGQSITTDMYARFLDTVLVGWMKIKNTAMAILGEIADGFFEAVKPLMGPVQYALDQIFNAVKANKNSFKQIFTGVLKLLQPALAYLQIWAVKFGNAMKDVFTPGKSVTLPFVKKGKYGTDIEDREVGGSVGEKIRAMFQSIASVVVETMDKAMRALSPAFTFLAQIFADALEAAFRVKAKLWENIGSLIAGAMVKAFVTGLKAELPDILRSIGDLFKNLGVPEKLRLGGKRFGMDIPLPTQEGLYNVADKMDAQATVKPKSGASSESGVSRFGTFLDKLMGAGQEAEKSGKKVEKVGKAFINFGDGLQEVNLGALEQGSKDMNKIFTKVEKSSEMFGNAIIQANNKASRALAVAQSTQRQVFQSQKKSK
jgi:hypothetical protein